MLVRQGLPFSEAHHLAGRTVSDPDNLSGEEKSKVDSAWSELTLEKGASYFIMVERDVEKTDRYLNYSYAPFGYAGYGYFGYHGGYYFRHRIYTGPDESVPISRYEAIAEIVVGGPELSGNKADVYRAQEVIENLGPKIVRPKS